jgi:hypothetical protein
MHPLTFLKRLARGLTGPDRSTRHAPIADGEDDDVALAMPPPDPASLLPSLHAFADPGATFGEWKGGDVRNGATQMPFFELSHAAHEFVAAAYRGNWVRPEILWSEWARSEQYRRLRTDAEAMRSASADDVAHMLTTLIRGDRFNAGMLAAAFADGLLGRIVERVGALAREERDAAVQGERGGDR